MASTKSKRIKAERPAIHDAWKAVLQSWERDIRTHKLALSGPLPAGSARKHQRKLDQARMIVGVLLNVRLMGKEISAFRWAERHALYPERPPICGRPSRHPHLCGCPNHGITA